MPKYYHKQINGSFQIQKMINKKMYYFGTFKTEKEAQDRVEFLKKENWNTKYATKKRKTNYIYYNGSSYRIDKNHRYYGSYPTMEEAKEAVAFLKKHDWNNRYVKTKEYKNHYGKYINHSISGNYVIMKSIGGKTKYYGTFKTLEDAESAVEFFKAHNWDRRYVEYKRNKLCLIRYITRNRYGTYVIQKYIDGKTEYFGTFSTLEDAKRERDELIRCNWDWNLICDGGL